MFSINVPCLNSVTWLACTVQCALTQQYVTCCQTPFWFFQGVWIRDHKYPMVAYIWNFGVYHILCVYCGHLVFLFLPLDIGNWATKCVCMDRLNHILVDCIVCIRNLISYKTTCIAMATSMTSWKNLQSNWLHVYGRSLCRISYRLHTQVRRTAMATKDASTDRKSASAVHLCFKWLDSFTNMDITLTTSWVISISPYSSFCLHLCQLDVKSSLFCVVVGRHSHQHHVLYALLCFVCCVKHSDLLSGG